MRHNLTKEGGFTFIEVMVAVVIVSIAAVGIMYGTVHAKGELRSLYLKERATDILVGYTEYWKGKIQSDNLSSADLADDLSGKDVFIAQSNDVNERVIGRLYYKIDKEPSHISLNPPFLRYRLRVWINWEHKVFTKNIEPVSREIETVITVLKFS